MAGIRIHAVQRRGEDVTEIMLDPFFEFVTFIIYTFIIIYNLFPNNYSGVSTLKIQPVFFMISKSLSWSLTSLTRHCNVFFHLMITKHLRNNYTASSLWSWDINRCDHNITNGLGGLY